MEVKLVIDGQEVRLNRFVVTIFSEIIVGMTKSLRGVKEDWKELELKVTR